MKNNNKKINKMTHKKSLFSLTKESNETLMQNNTVKNKQKKDLNFSILKYFIEFNKNVRNKRTKTEKRNFSDKTVDKEINWVNNKNKNFNNYTTNINNNINNNIYYNKIINKMPNDNNKNDDEKNKDINLIACIKNSLDDNLKNMFDFSYQSFLNKESEREG